MISVIVTLHNKENTIISALQSIVAQTAQQWEAVIVDNASTDGSEYQVRSYLIDRRMRYVKLDQQVSVQQARQKGLDLTSGEWVLFLDGSDYLEVSALEALYLVIKKYGTLIGTGNFSLVEHGDKRPQNYISEGKFTGKQVKYGKVALVTGSTLMNRSVAHLPETWQTLDVAYTDHLVVINGEGEQPLVKAQKLTWWKRIFSSFSFLN